MRREPGGTLGPIVMPTASWTIIVGIAHAEPVAGGILAALTTAFARPVGEGWRA
jgi:hypothetical protein